MVLGDDLFSNMFSNLLDDISGSSTFFGHEYWLSCGVIITQAFPPLNCLTAGPGSIATWNLNYSKTMEWANLSYILSSTHLQNGNDSWSWSLDPSNTSPVKYLKVWWTPWPLARIVFTSYYGLIPTLKRLKSFFESLVLELSIQMIVFKGVCLTWIFLLLGVLCVLPILNLWPPFSSFLLCIKLLADSPWSYWLVPAISKSQL